MRLARSASRPKLLTALFATLALVLTACPEETGTVTGGGGEEGPIERVENRGFAYAGFANEPPYGYVDEAGNVTGQSPEVARAVFEEMGIPEMEGVSVEWAGLIPGLQAERFDVVAAGMFLTEERCEEVLFTDPDYAAPQAFAVAAGNPLDLNNYQDIADNPDATLGIMAGAVEEGYALDVGVPEGQIESFTTDTDLMAGLQAGRVDAIALTSISIRDLVERADDEGVEMTEPFVPVIDGEEELGYGGYAFRYDDWELRDAFNEVLNDMKQEQTPLLEIVEEHGFGEPELSEAQDVTLGDVCPDAQERLEELRNGDGEE